MKTMETDRRTKEAVELLERMVSIPSVSREEKEAADLLEQFMHEHGLQPQRSGNNLWCTAPIYNKEKPTLLLNAHIDTVKPASSWTRPPSNPRTRADASTGWEQTTTAPAWFRSCKRFGNCLAANSLTI